MAVSEGLNVSKVRDLGTAHASLGKKTFLRAHPAAAAGGAAGDSAWLQEMFGSFLSLHDAPTSHQALDALRASRTASANDGESMRHQDQLVPVLHMLLPNASSQVVSMLTSLI